MNPENTSAQAPVQNPPVQSTSTTTTSSNTLMGVLSYLGPLVIISILLAKQDPFVKFHAKQGLVLLTIEVAAWILSVVIPMFWILFNLINLAAFVFSVIGIINVVQKKEKELPLVGGLSKHFPL